MEGILRKLNTGLHIGTILDDEIWTNYLPLVPSQVEKLQSSISTLVANEGKIVEYEVIDDYTHPELYKSVPWCDGQKYARITNIEIFDSSYAFQQLVNDLSKSSPESFSLDVQNQSLEKELDLAAKTYCGTWPSPNLVRTFIAGANWMRSRLSQKTL